MSKPLSFKIILLLAVVQEVAVLLRGLNWVLIGGDLFGQGILLLPVIGALTILRGLFIVAVALLYGLFAIGALLGKDWARWCCLAAVIINLLLVLSAFAQGAAVVDAMAWSAIPVILLFYIFSQTGRGALRAA